MFDRKTQTGTVKMFYNWSIQTERNQGGIMEMKTLLREELVAAAASIQDQLLSDWIGEQQQAVRKELKYSSALLTYAERFLKKLDRSRHAALRLGALLGTVESLERLQYERSQTVWAEARFSKEPVKHLPEVVQALETHVCMSHSELSEYLEMNASTLTEAMKKIIRTGAVQVSSLGKYKIYSLSDTGVRYGKELRKKRNESVSLTEVCESLDRLWKSTGESEERQKVKMAVMALLDDGNDLNIHRGDTIQLRDRACPHKILGVMQAVAYMNVVGSPEKVLTVSRKTGFDEVRNTRSARSGAESYRKTLIEDLKLENVR